MGRSPRPEGKIVSLTRVSRGDAQMIKAMLDEHGIPGTTGGGDANGWYPNLSFSDGCPVLVFEDDLDRARHLLESAPELAADDER